MRRLNPENQRLKTIAHKIIRGEIPPEAAGAFKPIVDSFTGTPSSSDDAFGMDPSFIETLKPFFQFLYYVYFRVDAEGTQNIPRTGPAILVANHSGGLPYDGTMIHLAVFNKHPAQRQVRFLVDNFVFDLPLFGRFIEKTGGVRANHENATTLLTQDNLIAVFPEGVAGISKTYDERYKLKRFGRGGFVRLAIRSGAPIIPTAVIGAEEIHPIIWKSRVLARPLGIPFIPFTPTFPWLLALGLVPLPTKWRIVFGKPVPFDGFKPKDAENDKLVQRHAFKIQNSVQKMIDAALKRRKSIWI